MVAAFTGLAFLVVFPVVGSLAFAAATEVGLGFLGSTSICWCMLVVTDVWGRAAGVSTGSASVGGVGEGSTSIPFEGLRVEMCLRSFLMKPWRCGLMPRTLQVAADTEILLRKQ